MSAELDFKIAELQDKIQKRAQDEIERIHKTHTRFMGMISAVGAVAIGALGFMVGSGYMDYKKQVDEVKEAVANSTTELIRAESERIRLQYETVVADTVNNALNAQVAELDARFKEIINATMNEPEMKDKIAVVANEITSKLSSEEILKNFDKFMKTTRSRLDSLESGLAKLPPQAEANSVKNELPPLPDTHSIALNQPEPPSVAQPQNPVDTVERIQKHFDAPEYREPKSIEQLLERQKDERDKAIDERDDLLKQQEAERNRFQEQQRKSGKR